ncbi:type II toxin-antitoxin system HicB family antitoxin [Mesorhizobium sp. LNJC394B00]|uniref:type II toxin-antitoxin system HicB family antitoxin n=1 Tax=unclassified Mesorhizobium TaxID=325217 RepID=UPI00040FF304|nr:type II toxin-antitoxin system HicB family antitoxin [Mesorhizobium sp. LNJC394B00]
MIRYVGILDGSDGVWAVRMPDLAGCHGAGANPAEAIADAASAMREWAEARIAKHLPMPNPRTVANLLQSGEIDSARGDSAVTVRHR